MVSLVKVHDHTPILVDRVECGDGFSVSIQASEYHYCSPRVTGLSAYSSYELGFPSKVEPLLLEYADDPENPTCTVYGYVPAHIINEVLAKHNAPVRVCIYHKEEA